MSSRILTTAAGNRYDLLGKPDEDSFRASDVTEPILVLVLHELTDQLRSVQAEPGERVVDVLDGEHDA